MLYGAETGAGVDAETRGECIGVEPPYTAKLGGLALWVPELSKQNFTITYEENNIARFSFLLQNCDVNRAAITDHLTGDFVIYRGATPVFTGTINSDGIEYLGIDKIRILGYAKSIKLGYEFYKHMLSADAEAVGSVGVTPGAGPIDTVLWCNIGVTCYNETSYANNSTINDVNGAFINGQDAFLIGADKPFDRLKIKYSTPGPPIPDAIIVTEYSTAAGWSILSCEDPTNAFRNSAGTYQVTIASPPGDWAKKAKGGFEKYWMRWRLTNQTDATIGAKLDQIWNINNDSIEDKTTEANNATVNDIEVLFNGANEGAYIGHNETFYTVKVQYSTKGVQRSSADWTMVEDTSESSILSLAVFDSYLYAGTGDSGKIYRSSNGTDWTMVEDTSESSILSLAVFDSYLYAGTGDSGKIYRSSNGTDWTMVEDTSESRILSLAVFGSYLYAGTGDSGKIYRSSNGTDWTMVEDIGDDFIYALTVFDSYLYAGTGDSGKIYRSSNGTDWTMVGDTGEVLICSLAVFGSYLYAGTYLNGKIYRSSNGTDWTMVGDTDEKIVYSLVVSGEYIYAGTGSPDAKIYRSSNGTDWTMVGDTGGVAIYSLAAFDGHLYAGTASGTIYRNADIAILKIEYSKGSGSWGTLDCIDTSQYFTADIGEHYLIIPNKPSDWAKDTVNGISKFWIRIVSVSGSYTTNPKLDQIWISQTDVCRVQFDNLYLDDMLDDVLIDTDYSFQKALKNSTFEEGVAPWTHGMTQSSTEKHSGTYSAKLVAAAANIPMFSEFMPAAGVKGITFWTYLKVLTTPPFRYCLLFYDRNGTYLSGEMVMTLTSVETGWTKHEYTHDPSTFPAGTKYVKLDFDFCNAANDPVGTAYIDDVVLESTVPHIIIPGMRGEYYSKLQWVAGLANAATWEDGDGCKQNYLWRVDSDDLIHVEQSTGIAFNDITSSLSVLTNKRSYFDMANRVFSLGSGDGINQTRAAVEDITAQTIHGLREALVTDARILEYEALKEFTQKALTISKTETKVITLNMPTYDWFEGGYAISDTIKLHQPVWGIPDETTYRIIRCDIGKDRVKIDVGDPRQHLDTIRADLKAQIDVSDIYMAGATNIYAQSVQGNMERTAANVYPLILKIRIPDDAVKINKVLLDWTLSGFRTYTSVVQDGGGSTPTSSAGGADAVTSAAHNLGTRGMDLVGAGAIATIADSAETDAPTQVGNTGFLVAAAVSTHVREYTYPGCVDEGTCALIHTIPYGGLLGPYNLSDDDHTQNVNLPVALGEVTDTHDHTVDAYGNHDHVVNIADHHHTVTIPDHTHPLTSGIIQESLGSPTLELYVNSVLIDNNYTGDNTDINIAGYMNTGAWNEIKLQPKAGTVALLRAELNAFVKIFIRSR